MMRIADTRRSRLATLLLSGALVLAGSSCFFREPRVPVEELRSVPPVVGEKVAVARDELEGDGFIVRIVPEGAPTPSPDAPEASPGTCSQGTVVAQDPAGAEDVRRAATITLTARGC